MSEHLFAGKTVTLLIDGEEKEYQLEEGISHEKGEEFINSMLGVDANEPPSEVEFAEIPATECPELKGLTTVCRTEGCEHTEVFDRLDGIKDSEWTELGLPKGSLTDGTDLHYAYCPHHSLSEDEGYEPEGDMGSHQFSNRVPNCVKEGLYE